MKTLLKPGKNINISNADYHAEKNHLSSSSLKLLHVDPRQYHQKYVLGLEKEFKNKDALNFGSLVHAMILEPEVLESEFVVATSRKGTKAYKEIEAGAKKNNQIIVTELQYAEAEALAKLVLGHKEIGPLLEGGVAEETFATCIDDVPIKVRTDYRKDKDIFDIKTTRGPIDKYSFYSTIEKYMYDLSAALYVDGLDKLYGEGHSFYFIPVSKDEYSVAVYKASKGLIEEGRKKYLDGLDKYKFHAENNWKFSVEEIGPDVINFERII